MGKGYSGADLIADLDVHYFYQGHDFDDPNDLTNHLQMTLSFAKDTDRYATNVEHIMSQAERYAKDFLEGNGNIDSGELYSSIKGERISPTKWTLHAPARDNRSHLYAGHIEYGFTDKAGQAHGPWPFLRPAVQLAAMDSRGELADALAYSLLYGELKSNSQKSYLALGRSNLSHSAKKSNQSFRQAREGYRGWDRKTKSMKEWGKTRNGFNDYRGFFPKGTTSNRYTTGTDEYWNFGEL